MFYSKVSYSGEGVGGREGGGVPLRPEEPCHRKVGVGDLQPLLRSSAPSLRPAPPHTHTPSHTPQVDGNKLTFFPFNCYSRIYLQKL